MEVKLPTEVKLDIEIKLPMEVKLDVEVRLRYEFCVDDLRMTCMSCYDNGGQISHRGQIGYVSQTLL